VITKVKTCDHENTSRTLTSKVANTRALMTANDSQSPSYSLTYPKLPLVSTLDPTIPSQPPPDFPMLTRAQTPHDLFANPVRYLHAHTTDKQSLQTRMSHLSNAKHNHKTNSNNKQKNLPGSTTNSKDISKERIYKYKQNNKVGFRLTRQGNRFHRGHGEPLGQ
jgi:hypothetical protein